MQLRTVKKQKNKAFEFGTSNKGDNLTLRNSSISKEHIEKEAASSNEVK
jgi:hypothetical protein